MQRRSPLALVLALITIASASLLVLSADARSQNRTFKPHPLTGASRQEIEQAALEFTQSHYAIISGTPQVVLTRPITEKEIPSLGFGAVNFISEPPPLHLVILKGNFDVQNFAHGRFGSIFVNYIVYIFDLKTGTPTGIGISGNGSNLREVLNDPTIPTAAPPAEPPLPASILKNALPQLDPISSDKLPYGSVAPEAATPTAVAPGR